MPTVQNRSANTLHFVKSIIATILPLIGCIPNSQYASSEIEKSVVTCHRRPDLHKSCTLRMVHDHPVSCNLFLRIFKYVTNGNVYRKALPRLGQVHLKQQGNNRKWKNLVKAFAVDFFMASSPKKSLRMWNLPLGNRRDLDQLQEFPNACCYFGNQLIIDHVWSIFCGMGDILRLDILKEPL